MSSSTLKVMLHRRFATTIFSATQRCNIVATLIGTLRWLDWIFLEGYLPSLSINYVGMSKRYGKKVTTTLLYKDENFLWSRFYCNRSRHGNVMTPLRFSFMFVFLCTRSFLKKSFKGVCTCHNCLHYGKVWRNSMTAFSKYFEMQF